MSLWKGDKKLVVAKRPLNKKKASKNCAENKS